MEDYTARSQEPEGEQDWMFAGSTFATGVLRISTAIYVDIQDVPRACRYRRIENCNVLCEGGEYATYSYCSPYVAQLNPFYCVGGRCLCLGVIGKSVPLDFPQSCSDN